MLKALPVCRPGTKRIQHFTLLWNTPTAVAKPVHKVPARTAPASAGSLYPDRKCVSALCQVRWWTGRLCTPWSSTSSSTATPGSRAPRAPRTTTSWSTRSPTPLTSCRSSRAPATPDLGSQSYRHHKHHHTSLRPPSRSSFATC